MDSRYGYIPDDIVRYILLFNTLPHTRSCNRYLRDVEDSLSGLRLTSIRNTYIWQIQILREGYRDGILLLKHLGIWTDRGSIKHYVRLRLPLPVSYDTRKYLHALGRYGDEKTIMSILTPETAGDVLIGVALKDDHLLALRIFSYLRHDHVSRLFYGKVAYNCGRSGNLTLYGRVCGESGDKLFSLGAVRGRHMQLCKYNMTDLSMDDRTSFALEAVLGNHTDILRQIIEAGPVDEVVLRLSACKYGRLEVVKMLGLGKDPHHYILRSLHRSHVNIYNWAKETGIISASMEEIWNMEF